MKVYSILFLIDSLTEGGAELALLVLIKALRKRNHNIGVFVLREPTGLATSFREVGAKLYLPVDETAQDRIDGFVRLTKILKENYFDLSNSGKISIEHDNKNPRTRLQINDVILSSKIT